MTDIELNLTTFSRLVAIGLVIVLLGQSLFAWVRLVGRVHFEEPPVERTSEPRAAWSNFPEVTTIGLVLMMLVLHLGVKFNALPDEPPGVNSPQVLANLAITGGLTLVLGLILYCCRPLSEYGLKRHDWAGQVRNGVQGFALALIPTGVLLLATAPFRTRETQNPLLTFLSDSPDPVTVMLVVTAAVIVAPLYEEMMFRVVLQGWLTARLGPTAAIPLTAVAFAAIHGSTDAIALVPLALVLGYVFDRRHSYVSVLVIHGLFNATMLTLALLTQAGQPGPVDSDLKPSIPVSPRASPKQAS